VIDELDRLVAEKVMGWRLYKSHPEQSYWASTPEHYALAAVDLSWTWDGRNHEPASYWQPTTNVANDYEVLVHVRENWDADQQDKFVSELTQIWYERCVIAKRRHIELHYEVGDYCKAAFHAEALLSRLRMIDARGDKTVEQRKHK
jgi:hypothetical protein